jgi:hypothetical protein
MEQEDYIKRQIDQLGRVLGKILSDLTGLKGRGQVNDGIQLANQTLKSESGLNTDDLSAIPTDQFIITLSAGKPWDEDNLEKLADILLLFAETPDQADEDHEKKIKLYIRALILYEHVELTSSTYSIDRHLKIGKIKKTIA